MKFKAFTLAEVLITLAIIGIVAAMTIPTLVANYQNKAWNTSSQVFERKLVEALKQMNTQQVLAGYRSTSEFVGALSKYFKITKVCSNNDILSCFEDSVSWDVLNISKEDDDSNIINISSIKSAADLGKEDWSTETIGVQFANGTTGIIAYNPSCKEQPFSNEFTGTDCISLVYDTNGFKKPNSLNKDVKGLNSFLKSCVFRSGSTCFSAPFQPSPITKAECENIKDDLNIKSCHYDNDYWAGAVKACGGVSKMPTMAQIAEIANYVYDKSDIGASTIMIYLKLDYDKVSELGFSATKGSTLYIYSGEEYDYQSSHFRIFESSATSAKSWGFAIRSSNKAQAFCLAE